MGLIVPLVSNILPLRETMSISLRDALDVYRKKIDLLKVEMSRLENIGISITQIIMGICFTIFGFITYYFIPLSIILKDYATFFFLILFILFVMIMGMILLSSVFEP